MTKQEIIDAIVGCAEKLKHVPTLAEVVEDHSGTRIARSEYILAAT